MESPSQRERARCVSLCRRRAELWRKTAGQSPAAGVLQEAEARANEAAYLADLLESGVELAELSLPDKGKADA